MSLTQHDASADSKEGAQPLLPGVRPHHPLGCDWLQLLTKGHLMINKNSAKRSASREREERKVDQDSGVRGKVVQSSSGQKRHRTEK